MPINISSLIQSNLLTNLVFATDNITTTTLYPLMVGASGVLQSANVTASKLSFNASTGALAVSGNVTAGNLVTTGVASVGSLSTTGNITVGNLSASSVVSVGLTPVTNNGVLQVAGLSSMQSIFEKATVTGTGIAGTVNFDVLSQSVLFYNSAATDNWGLNIRGNSTLALNSIMATGQTMTIALITQNGATPKVYSSLSIDGTSNTVSWQGAASPSSGNANSYDVYTFSIIKTGSGVYTVLGSQTQFA